MGGPTHNHQPKGAQAQPSDQQLAMQMVRQDMDAADKMQKS